MKQQHIQHLYWRIGFGISICELDNPLSFLPKFLTVL
jgi:hypothetical protein